MCVVRQRQFAISMEEFAPVLKEIRELEALWRINSEQIAWTKHGELAATHEARKIGYPRGCVVDTVRSTTAIKERRNLIWRL